jgi:hypothetical protein
MLLNDVFPEFGGEAYRSGSAVRLTRTEILAPIVQAVRMTTED